MPPVCVLNIGGLDPSAGAGITADVKTCEVNGVYGLTAATSVTCQNHHSFESVSWLTTNQIISQLIPLLGHYEIKAVKIGLIENLETLVDVLGVLENLLPDVPIIWDPVLASGSGFQFHKAFEIESLSNLCSRFTLVTPNKEEALLIFPVLETTSPEEFSHKGLSLLIKSFKLTDESVLDVLIDNYRTAFFSNPRLENSEKHGSGCFLSTSIAAELAKGQTLSDAVKDSLELTGKFLQSSTNSMGIHSGLVPNEVNLL